MKLTDGSERNQVSNMCLLTFQLLEMYLQS
jgi:hypothetical protein